MKSAFWRATALLIAIGLMMPAAAMAEGMAGEVAHSAMGGSTIMNTSAQLNTWTHWATKYGNFTEVDTGDLRFESPEAGQATLIWDYDGDNTLLFRARQYDLGSQNSNFMWGGTLDMPFFLAQDFAGGTSSNNAFTGGQMFNVALARELSGGGAWSAGVVFAAESDEDKLANDDGSTDESTAFGGQFTWGNGNGLDVAASFFSESSTFNSGVSGEADAESDVTLFDGYVRYEHNDWIYQGGAVFGTGSVGDDDASAIGLLANVGRFLKNDSDGTVTVEFLFNYYQDKFEPNGGGEEKDSFMTLPGMRSACTQMLTDHFGLMLGANAYYVFESETENDGTNDTQDENSKGMTFMWDAGVFYQNGNLRIDAQLEQSNLGYLLSLGNDQDLLIRAGATYQFN